jgi:tetratricopeptide (TPR) repeat protein
MPSALKVARSTDDPKVRGVVLERILDPRRVTERLLGQDDASSSVNAETPDEALNVIAAFTDSRHRAMVLAIVAVAFANAGRPAEAVELAKEIDADEPRAFAWHAIGEARARAGLTAPSIASFDRAVQAALSFERHDWMLSRIAISQAEAGQIDEAVRVAGLIGGTSKTAGYVATVNAVNVNSERRVALRAIAKAQARAGRMAEAEQNAHALVSSGYIIPPGLGVVAEALAQVGRIDEAIETARIEDNSYRRSELLARIAKARAAAGRIDEAKRVAPYVAEQRHRADALSSIGAAQVEAGHMADAMATFAEAMQIARSIRYKNVVTSSLLEIAERLPE